MKRIDIILALVTGEITAWFFYYLLKDIAALKIESLGLILAVSFPILALVGTWISFLIGKRFLWVFQLAKYLLIGVLATITDLGVLNFLMWTSGIAIGLWYSVFKGISFLIAVTNSYFWNKHWTFEKRKEAFVPGEFSKFLAVTAIGLFINVGIASFIVNVIGLQFEVSKAMWATIGAFTATFFAWIWNFLSSKFIVFKS